MAYLSEDALRAMGFASIGRNVKISEKASIYEPEKMVLGDNSRIDDFCVVSGRVEMGRNVFVGALSVIAGGIPGIFFDDFSGAAYACQVFSQSDDYSGRTMTNPTVPRAYKAEIMQAVHIGRHVLIGAGSAVMPGASIGEGTTIGAHSLLLEPTEPWSIYAGSPAKRIKARKMDLLELEARYLSDNS